MSETTKKVKNVYIISEGKYEKWTQIGVAFLNKDGSLNVILDALPINGKLQIRDRREDNKGEGEV